MKFLLTIHQLMTYINFLQPKIRNLIEHNVSKNHIFDGIKAIPWQLKLTRIKEQEDSERDRGLRESSVGVETDVQAHEEKGSRGKDGLTHTKS